MASPGSWNVGFVGALVDLGGGGGVGKDMDMGRGLEWGMFAGSWVARGAMLCRVVEVLTEVVRLRLELVVDSRGGGGRRGATRPAPTPAAAKGSHPGANRRRRGAGW